MSGEMIDTLERPLPPFECLDIHGEYTTREIFDLPPAVTIDTWEVLELSGLNEEGATSEERNDAYNPYRSNRPAKVYADNNASRIVTATRTERSEGDYEAEIRFCETNEQGKLVELEDVPRIKAEDGMIEVMPDGMIYVTGVIVEWEGTGPTRKCKKYETGIWRGRSLQELELITTVPGKCVRVKAISRNTEVTRSTRHHDDVDSNDSAQDNEPYIMLLSIRPQGPNDAYDAAGDPIIQDSGRGKMQYMLLTQEQIQQLDDQEFVAELIRQAEYVGEYGIFDGIESWGGNNGSAHLGKGWMLAGDHGAYRSTVTVTEKNKDGSPRLISEEEIKHYAGFLRIWNPLTGEGYILGPHVDISKFPGFENVAKNRELTLINPYLRVGGVIYTGSLNNVCFAEDGSITFDQYVGLGDRFMALAHCRIPAGPVAEFIRSVVGEPEVSKLQESNGLIPAVLAQAALGAEEASSSGAGSAEAEAA